MTPDIVIKTLTADNKNNFVKTLESELCIRFNCDVESLPINYGYDKMCGLLHYISENQLDSYYMLYLNGKFRSASGGIIRNFCNEKIYQGQWRFFNTIDISKGLNMHSWSLSILTNKQLIRAKKFGCTKFILSYNIHNKRLHDIHINYQFSKIWGPDHGFRSSVIPVPFNGVEQFLLIKEL